MSNLLTAIIPHPNGSDFRQEVYGATAVELAKNVREFITLENYGASDIGSRFSVYRDGNVIATVCYNGSFHFRDPLYKEDYA